VIGEIISHYRIIEKIGEGSNGVVYKAEDTKLGRFVALKFFPIGLGANEEKKERFIQEAMTASALDHTNICTVHEIEETKDGRIFICMALYEGGTLTERIKGGQLKSEEVIDVSVQVAQGMKKAHRKRIIHRDIKPQNLILTDDGVVKIVDFGLAKLVGQKDLTKEGITVGTVGYMSPEQARGEEVDQRTDIWSLGVVMYEMITGQLPFKGENAQAVIYSILKEEPEPIASSLSNIPLELKKIVNKCLAKECSNRYQYTDELIEDLLRMNINLKELRKVYKSEVMANKKDIYPDMRRQRRRFLIPALLILVVIIAAGYFIFKVKQDAGTSVTEEILRPRLKNSIAVLPFKDFSPKKDQGYFCDGLTDTIIGKFAKLKGLKVISMTSVMKYKNQVPNIKEIGKELKVGHILEGSVSKYKDNIRIKARLIDVVEDSLLWNETYHRKLESMFKVQDEISLMVVNKLEIKLVGEQKQALTKRHTHDLEAYNLYIKGRFYWNKRTGKAIKTGVQYFKQAIEKDPNYALAYVGLALSYTIMPTYGDMPEEEADRKATAAALKALEIDETLAEPYLVLLESEWYDYNWPVLEKGYKHTIELNPNNATAHHWYSDLLITMGRFDEALKEIHRAGELDPLSLMISSTKGFALYISRQYDRAIKQLRKTLDMEPNFVPAHRALGRVYIKKNMYKEAIASLERATILSGGAVENTGLLGYAYAISGQQDRAEKLLRELADRSKQDVKSFYFMALISAGLDKKDEAFKWLNKCYEERVSWMHLFKVEPVWDSIRTDPRYIALLKKMNLE
jgi:serine/threonine protein kinase/Tfp pilus assembly protein PilF